MAKGKARIPTEQDRYIGQRIREARLSGRISQAGLGELIGVSFQQIQKYENGTNRVNGARIGRLVTALNRPLAYFFPNVTDVRAAPLLSSFLASKEGQRIAELWSRLTPADRVAAVKMIEHLAKDHDND